MKALIITPSVKKESDGWGRYSFEVIEHLKKNNVEVTFDWKDSYDFIHSFEISRYAVKSFIYAVLKNKPLMFSAHGSYSVAPLQKWWKRIILKIIFKRSKKIFCNSEYTEKKIKKSVPSAPTTTVLLGLTKFNVGEVDKNNIRNSPIILTVGEIKDRKGQLETVKAVLKLKKKYPHILYVMIGNQRDQNYISKIKEAIKGNERSFLLLEKVPDDKMAFWYKRANVFCLNSNNDEVHGHFEGFGLVILEAGQFGIPSVGSRDCGIESAISDGVNGYLSKQRDTDDIVSKIERALVLNKNSVTRERIIEFTNTYDWNKTVRQYIEIYSS